MYSFDAEKTKNDCVRWIKEWFDENGVESPAVIGISGGKDSSVVAALCTEALGADRVYGVLMPQGEQFDIDYSYDICKYLKINYTVINIGETIVALSSQIAARMPIGRQASQNLPARIRMAAVYAVSQCKGGRVANTGNFSEGWIGYSTRYGDGAGDFAPISRLTVTEVKSIARALGLPEKFIEKPPTDGLCGKTDEENLGFSYGALDRYIREGVNPPERIKEKIDALHDRNLFKLLPMPYFDFRP